MMQDPTSDITKNDVPDTQNEMSTISDITRKSIERGYTANFMMKEAKLYSSQEERLYAPEEVKINNFYRFEGQSDPGDESVIYEIETTTGTKGVLINAYGHYGDEDAETFIKQVEEITKKTDKK